MVQPRRFVAAPAVPPLPFGLQSVALINDDSDPHNAFGIEFESLGCGTAHRSIAACYDNVNTGPFFPKSEETQLVTEGGAGLTSFTLTFSGQTTGSIAAAATAATVQTALEALSNIAPGDVAVSGSAGGPYTVAFAGAYADTDVPQMTATPTGGSGTVTVTTPTSGAVITTTDDGVDIVTGEPFTVYALHSCRMLAGGLARAQELARSKLAMGEWRSIEDGFRDFVLDLAADLTPTPGTPVSPRVGIAILEEAAAAAYGGAPVLHIGRRTGTHLSSGGVIGQRSGRLETAQGAWVASHAGFTPGGTIGVTTAGAGERWAFATGAVLVNRGPVAVTEPVRRQTSGSPNNEVAVLAHRNVVAAAECFVAAVLIQDDPT